MTQILDQLEINQTFFVQFALFGLFFVVLSTVYLRPFQRLIETRNQKLQGDVQDAAELLRSVEAKLAEYERALANSRAEAHLASEKFISEARAKEDAAINAYKDDLKKDYLKIVQKLQQDKASVEAEMSAQVSQMADSVAQKILGK